MTALDTLKAMGFKERDTGPLQQLSDDLGLSQEGEPHVVVAWLEFKGVHAVVEKNISPERAGGVDTITKHPAVLILESERGRVCIPNHDVDANADLIKEIVNGLAVSPS